MKVRNIVARLRNAVIRLLAIVLPPWNISWRIMLLIFGGVGVVIVLVTLLVTVWLVPGPELSGDTVRQIDRAEEACSLGMDASHRSECSDEVWKACHTSRAFSEEQGELRAGKYFEVSMYICDLAVLADAGELASVLADRYDKDFEKTGFYPPLDGLNSRGDGIAENTIFVRWFILFHDLVNLEFSILYETSPSPNNLFLKDLIAKRNSELADSYGELPLYLENREKYPIYSNFSLETKKALRNLTDSVADYFDEFRGTASLPVTGVNPKVGENLWEHNTAEMSELPDTVKQICDEARVAIRDRSDELQEDLSNCLKAGEFCGHAWPASSIECSLESGTAEFENMWQRLPDICFTANEITDTGDDECRDAALAMCDYQLVSPEDDWIGQLVSMRDFACGVAGKISQP